VGAVAPSKSSRGVGEDAGAMKSDDGVPVG